MPGDDRPLSPARSVSRSGRLVALLVGLGWACLSAAASAEDRAAEIDCLAQTIYFEARGEPLEGKLAVGHVVMNRAADPGFPSTVCEVVRQGGERPLFGCQFTWWCDGLSDEPKNRAVWCRVVALAHLIYWGGFTDPTDGALWYHADYVEPAWRSLLEQGPTIGAHVFYRTIDPIQQAATLPVDSAERQPSPPRPSNLGPPAPPIATIAAN